METSIAQEAAGRVKRENHDLALSTVQGHLKKLGVRYKVIKLKPLLTQIHRDNRLKFILQQVDKKTGQGRGILKFLDHMNLIMVDESWLNLMTNGNKVMICDEVDVLIAPECQHKSHIEKIMFLAAVARPRTLPDGTYFDGKIGIFPCVEWTPTQRKSKAGPAGTLVAKNKNADSEFYHNLFSEEGGVFDKIEEKMPWLRGGITFIQQDGATPHTGNDTVAELEQAGTGDGWNVKVKTQSSQSPDLNVLDLGFFHSFKSKLREKLAWCTDRNQFMDLVQETWDEYPAEKLDGIWGCLYNNYRCIMACDGDNQYKQAHNGGRKRAENTVNLDDYNRLKNKFK